jgi:hypothetical protein
MLLDLGATVLRIDRPEPSDLGIRALRYDSAARPLALALDLKRPEGKALGWPDRARRRADRGVPSGVTERFGLGLMTASRAIRASSMAGSSLGSGGRWRTPLGTTSTTLRSPAHCTPSGGTASRRRRP